jgi:1-deoxy-D-xylulose-5-phosphate reductoisomerase
MRTNKNIAILGSTGSIGTQALQVIEAYPENFDISVLSTNTHVELLAEQTRRFKPRTVIIGDAAKYDLFKSLVDDLTLNIYTGRDALAKVVESDDIDVVLVSLVGYAGLIPTIHAIKNGKDIALANKETLVIAGDLIKSLAKKHQTSIYPVDSEHSAIFQCLAGEKNNKVEKIYLTASGGPLWKLSADRIEHITRSQALNHPTWSMGDKITIDSASLMNKGLEAIEAQWLFDLKPEQIDIVIHPQSIVHSIVQFVDGSMKAQMGLPDMKLPILYALTAPHRLKTNFERFNFKDFSRLTFEEPDLERFPNINLAYEAMKRGGNMPCILNASNEIAVKAFLNEQLGFHQMSGIIDKAMHHIPHIAKPNLEDYMQTDEQTRVYTESLILKSRK